MTAFSVRRIASPDEKASIASDILLALPDWFGLPDSTQKYIDDSRNMPFFAAVREGQAVGFAALKETSPCAGEIYVMGVLPAYHRSGIGRQMFAAIRAEAIARGYRLLQVKTVQTGHYEEYDRTNAFYQRMGFLPLECLPTLWDEWNPCQLMVKYIAMKQQPALCKP